MLSYQWTDNNKE